MISAARFLMTVTVLTVWHAGRALVNSWRGVRHRPGGVYDEIGRSWGRRLIRWNRLHATVEGFDRLEPGQPYVYVANHVSFVDIWAALALLPGSIRFVFKKELERVPVFGPALGAAGHIAIDRRNRASAFGAYDDAARQVRAGTSAVVFAEGTRSRDGRLMPLKKGPFVLAIAAGVPVVPLAVVGTYDCLPRGGIAPRPAPIALRIGTPMPTAGLDYEDRDRLSDDCRRVLLELGVPGPA